MWEIDFQVISIVENSNKFQKNQVLEGKFSWGRYTWMSTIQFKYKELWCAFGVVGKILMIQI
jgi:hypothetical protein